MLLDLNGIYAKNEKPKFPLSPASIAIILMPLNSYWLAYLEVSAGLAYSQ
jgi:hypothetical protein